MGSNANKRQSLDSPSSRGSMSLRRRRSGLRSNKKRLVNTANDVLESKKLRSIPELVKEECSQRDVSSSEKPKVGAKLVNDTILEEREEMHDSREEEMMDDDEEVEGTDNYRLQQERTYRQGIMSKLSKKMVRDFAEQKKKSLTLSSQPSFTQLEAQRLKEEYLDRTVYKITKGRSPTRHTPVQEQPLLPDLIQA